MGSSRVGQKDDYNIIRNVCNIMRNVLKNHSLHTPPKKESLQDLSTC